MLPIIAFRKGTSLKQITGTNTIHNNKKLTIIIQEHMPHAIQHVTFAVNNLLQQQHSRVINQAKCLKSTIKSTVKAASLFTYFNAISATFNTLINQKHHSTIGSITTERMSKIPMQYQLANISTGTIITLQSQKIHYHRATNIKRKTKKVLDNES